MDKLKLRQAIVVEGKYDQNALRQLVDTPIYTTNGFTGKQDPALQRQLPLGEKGLPIFPQRAHIILIKGIQQQGVRRQRTAGKTLLPGLHQPLIAGGEVWSAGEQGLPAWFQTLGFRHPDPAQPAQQKLRHLRRRRCLALFDLG